MVISPQMLWAEHDRTLLPLDVSEIASVTAENGVEKHLYFNGEATPAGCTRIYARLFVPTEKTNKLVIIMLDPDSDISKTDISEYTGEGKALLIVDYAGNVADRMRFTIYPPPLSFANYSAENLYKKTESPQKSCHYVWTEICLRAITFAQSEGYEKVALVGVGRGGAPVLRSAAICDYPSCAASFFSPGFFPPADDPELMEISVSLDVTGYSQILKVPFLHQCCSNDTDSSLDAISELSNKSADKDILYISKRSSGKCEKNILNIVPRATRIFTKETIENLKMFLNLYLGDENSCEIKDNLAPPLNLSISGGEKRMYFSVKCAVKLKEAQLYVSHGVTNPAYRNWRAVSLEKAGEDEYIGYTEVYSLDKPIYSFVSATTQEGFTYSTQVIKKLPSSLDITPTTIVKRRLIYDSDMGTDDFFTEGDGVPLIKKGPFSISGICAQNGLFTYKLGDVAFSGGPDVNLQFLLFSPTPQEITFSFTDSDRFLTYSCKKYVTPDTDWTKVMISPSELRSSEGTFTGWNNVILLKIDAPNEIIISSILWV